MIPIYFTYMDTHGYAIDDTVTYVDSPTDDGYYVPCNLVKDVESTGKYTYICLLFAHDIQQSEHEEDDMERFYFRIRADNDDDADDTFMHIPEIQKYVSDLDLNTHINSIYDIDQWDALVSILQIDPRLLNEKLIV
jgi:hypothetical protein